MKKHHTKKKLFEIKGQVPSDVIKFLRKKYGTNMEVLKEEKEFENIFNTKWYKDVKSSLTPGETIKIYRENFRLTQTELGKNLGRFTRQKISDMETGKRGISKEVAKKLSAIFNVPIDRFI
ncbi:MAG TPA: helix-turn-helix transcriptional regulator [Nitrospinota bacterium]|nr:helix-turn-helix transcriptional regulator [Nitrospinota bacterium]